MAELSPAERDSLDARIASVNRGTSRTYTEAEIDEIWRLQDTKDELNAKGRAA
jgi:hypothetical protein